MKHGSPIFDWYMIESRKREQNLDNEIDRNEIDAALKGFKNKWSECVKEHPEIFRTFLNNGKLEWSLAIKALYGEHEIISGV